MVKSWMGLPGSRSSQLCQELTQKFLSDLEEACGGDLFVALGAVNSALIAVLKDIHKGFAPNMALHLQGLGEKLAEYVLENAEPAVPQTAH